MLRKYDIFINQLTLYNMNQEERIQKIEEQLLRISAFYELENFPSKVVMGRQLVLKDQAGNVVFDSQNSNGFSLGSVGGKVGLYGETPVTQATSISAPSSPGTTYAQGEAQSAVNAINAIRTVLSNIGITA
jgi:hypothetical protein